MEWKYLSFVEKFLRRLVCPTEKIHLQPKNYSRKGIQKINKFPRKERKHKKWSWRRVAQRSVAPKARRTKNMHRIFILRKVCEVIKTTFPFRRLVRFEWKLKEEKAHRKGGERHIWKESRRVFGNSGSWKWFYIKQSSFIYFYLMWRFYCYV